MTDKSEPQDPIGAANAVPRKKEGFGAFAEQYRERWASEHPDARKPEGRDVPAGPAPGTDAPTTPRAADGGDADETPGS